LASYGAKSTFFVNGQNWGAPITDASNAGVIQRMIADGHQVGSHTYNHADLSTIGAADITSQMTTLETALVSLIGKYPTYMRPPYFSCNDACLSVMNDLGYHTIFTNLDTFDYNNDSPTLIVNSENIFGNAISASNPASNNFLVLSHDVHQNTVNTLVKYMLDTLKAKGYRAVTVGECLGDPAANWYRTN